MTNNNSKTECSNVVDLNKLAEEFDVETAKELALAFLEDTEPAIKKIDDAIAKKNSEEVRSQSHLLKGCCRIVNADALQKAASELELNAKEANWNNILVNFNTVKPLYKEVKEAVLEYTNSED